MVLWNQPNRGRKQGTCCGSCWISTRHKTFSFSSLYIRKMINGRIDWFHKISIRLIQPGNTQWVQLGCCCPNVLTLKWPRSVNLMCFRWRLFCCRCCIFSHTFIFLLSLLIKRKCTSLFRNRTVAKKDCQMGKLTKAWRIRNRDLHLPLPRFSWFGHRRSTSHLVQQI